MYEFDYHRPGSVEEAVDALKKASDGRALAGGMSLVPTLKLRLAKVSDLIDLGGISSLSGIKVANKSVNVGATTLHEDVATSKEVSKAIAALSSLASGIGDPQVRHRGTIGGSICNNDPAADYPAAIVGLGATIKTNQREIAGDDFFPGLFETALEEGELVTGVSFPVPDKAAYIKFPNLASRFAIVGVFVSQTGSDVRCAVAGAGACVFRESKIEEALSKSFAPDTIEGITISPDGLNSDIHGSAEYRAHLIPVLAKRAVVAAR